MSNLQMAHINQNRLIFTFDEYIAAFDIGQKLESMIMLFSLLAIHFGTDRFFFYMFSLVNGA